MKKVAIILVILMMALSGCKSPWKSAENRPKVSSETATDSAFGYTKPLTLENVKKTFAANGVELNTEQKENGGAYKIGNAVPNVYTIEPNNTILLVYIYQSIAQRKEAFQSEGHIWDSSQLPQAENLLSRAYPAKNVVIVYMLNPAKFQSNPAGFEQTAKSIDAAVYSLNQGQQLVFADKGEYWDASYTVKYYQHWYKDKTGTTNVVQNSSGTWSVKYLGADPESIRQIKYEYQVWGNSKGSINGPGILQKIGQDYYLRLGNKEGNGIPDQDDVYTLTIEWDGKKESLQLKTAGQ